MTEKEFKALGTGDIVRYEFGRSTMVVTGNYGGRVTAVNTSDLTNPSEWHLVLKAKHVNPRRKRRVK